MPYEGSIENAESNLRKKPSTEPNNIDADTMSNIVEEDDKSSYEDLEEITDENFDVLSRMEDAILSDGDDDEGRKKRKSRRKKKKLMRRKRKQSKKLMRRNNKIIMIQFKM